MPLPPPDTPAPLSVRLYAFESPGPLQSFILIGQYFLLLRLQHNYIIFFISLPKPSYTPLRTLFQIHGLFFITYCMHICVCSYIPKDKLLSLSNVALDLTVGKHQFHTARTPVSHTGTWRHPAALQLDCRPTQEGNHACARNLANAPGRGKSWILEEN